MIGRATPNELWSRFAAVADEHANEELFIARAGATSFADLKSSAVEFAVALDAAVLRHQIDTVVVSVRNVVNLTLGLLAAARLDLPAIVAPPELPDPWVAHLTDLAGHACLVRDVPGDESEHLVAAAGALFLAPTRGASRREGPRAYDVGLLTSGTSGTPRICAFSWPGLTTAVDRLLALEAGARQQTTLASLFGYHHVGGLTVLLRCLLGAHRLATIESVHPRDQLTELSELGVSDIVVTPALASLLSRVWARERPGGFDIIGVGTDHCNARMLATLARRSGALVVASYGATEFGGAVMLKLFDGAPAESDAAAFDMTVPGVDARIETRDGELLPLGSGATGTLYVRTPSCALGYLTTTSIEPLAGTGDWATVGDVVSCDPSGGAIILGRPGDQVTVRGFTLSTTGIEQTARAMPQVATASLSTAGGRMHLHVEPTPGITLSDTEVRRHLTEQLPPWLVPARISVDPRTEDMSARGEPGP